ncbi:harmonin-like [Xenia sp. Carnegie-2017]|uniref:harmonin-like n=1 Tax=Xenia sp. Carnegie-2017 TaxID=2897299 RepID=UPI001F03B216|nr:harmonin-like [Xenia sp. Carnegie-2017]
MVMFGQQEMYIHAKHFREKVNNCIDSSEEILSFYEALKSYTRSLLQPDDCQEFVSKIPIPPSEGIRIVKIQKVASESLGVGLRGGKEHGVGVFISSVVRGSRGDIAGLKAGDEVLLVNGFTIRESTHSEVVSLIRNRRNLRIKVRSTRKYPDRINGKLIWKSMDDKENVFRYNANVLNHLVSQLTLTRNQSPVLQIRDTDKHVKFVVGPQGLGCE